MNLPALFLQETSIKEAWSSYSDSVKQDSHSDKTTSEKVQSFTQLIKIIQKESLPYEKLPKPFPAHDRGGAHFIRCAVEALSQSPEKEEQWENIADVPLQYDLIKLMFAHKYRLVTQRMLGIPDYAQSSQVSAPKVEDILNCRVFQDLEVSSLRFIALDSNKRPFKLYQKGFDKLREHNKGNTTDLSEPECCNIAKIMVLGSCDNLSALDVIVEWALDIKKYLGEEALACLFEPDFFFMNGKDNSIPLLIKVCQSLYELDSNRIYVHDIIEKYYECYSLNTLQTALEVEKIKLFEKMRDDYPVAEVLKNFTAENPNLSETLSGEDLQAIENDYQEVLNAIKEIRAMNPANLRKMVQEIKSRSQKHAFTSKDKIFVLALAREYIHQEFKIQAYHVQMLTVLALLLPKNELKGRIAQVKTGEGKSTIISMLAAVLALQGKTVDIITSSRYLAERDQRKYAKFFSAFGITCSNICTDDPDQTNFSGQIIYGTNYDFEFAILRQYLYNQDTRIYYLDPSLQRPFNCVIVDEVDNFLIDKSMDSARIGNLKQTSQKWLYSPVLQFVEENCSSGVQESHTEDLRSYLKQFEDGKHHSLVSQMSNFHLKKLLKSAHRACFVLKENQDYVIKATKSFRSGEEVFENQVVIVDYQLTGRLHDNSRWSGGIHEFLEMKHNLEVSEESVLVAALCHPAFFDYYTNIYGLTGTMGSKEERDEVKTLYKVDTFDVPTHHSPQIKGLDSIYSENRQSYYEAILSDINSVRAHNRPCLILCRSIQESINLSAFLNESEVQHQSLTTVQNEKEDFIIARAGHPRIVTIATNAAGRGTDIILHPDAKKGGGLHLLLSFYPLNDRVKVQGIGRTGRQGAPGTYRVIISGEDQAVHELKVKSGLLNLIIENTDSSVVFSLLEHQKNIDVKNGSLSRRVQSEIQRIHHKVLALFFEKLSNWYLKVDQSFIESIAKKLSQLPSRPENKNGFKDTMWKDVQEKMWQTLAEQEPSNGMSNKNLMIWGAHLDRLKNLITQHLIDTWGDYYNSLDDIDHPLTNLENSQIDNFADLLGNYIQTVEQGFAEAIEVLLRFLDTPQKALKTELSQMLGIVME